MAFSRRFLPAMSELLAFEAAARLGSFTAAASELHLTQSAVSRQVRSLEERLGSRLFVRERQTVRLSRAGEAYAAEVREVLSRISQATLRFRANPNGGALNLAILPTFGTRWLAPRLPRFLAASPEVTVNLSTRLAPFDFRADPMDAAIHFGRTDWPGAEFEELMREEVVPACSPALRKQHRFRQPADLLKAPLLHLRSRPDAWRKWFMEMHVDVGGSVPGMQVDEFAVAAQAAAAGIGIALLPRFLTAVEFDRGDLVHAIDGGGIESTERYYLVWPASRSNYAPLLAFREWLRVEVS